MSDMAPVEPPQGGAAPPRGKIGCGWGCATVLLWVLGGLTLVQVARSSSPEESLEILANNADKTVVLAEGALNKTSDGLDELFDGVGDTLNKYKWTDWLAPDGDFIDLPTTGDIKDPNKYKPVSVEVDPTKNPDLYSLLQEAGVKPGMLFAVRGVEGPNQDLVRLDLRKALALGYLIEHNSTYEVALRETAAQFDKIWKNELHGRTQAQLEERYKPHEHTSNHQVWLHEIQNGAIRQYVVKIGNQLTGIDISSGILISSGSGGASIPGYSGPSHGASAPTGTSPPSRRSTSSPGSGFGGTRSTK